MPDKSREQAEEAQQTAADGAGSVAVALKSNSRLGGDARVIASGRGAVAEQILQIAFERGVKVRTDADLAEILATLEIESEIPLGALAAVAEILSYVYRTQSAPPDQADTPSAQGAAQEAPAHPSHRSSR